MKYPVTPLPNRLSRQDLLLVSAIGAGYLLLSSLLIGFKTDQVVLVTLFGLLYLATPATRKFILGFSVFIVFWVTYDYMKAFPNYWFNDVHIKSLYDFERSLFGIREHGAVLTPNEYLEAHSVVLGDVLSGFFYLCWIPVPLAFAGFLFYKDRDLFLRFSLTFLLANLLGFVVYYLYPAAPPWYVRDYGFVFDPLTPGNTAGLIRFDQFFGVTVFQSIYSKGSNVFAAMPSLHSAYPLIVTYYAWKSRSAVLIVFTGIITVGIWFAAVYSGHHYIVDVVAGIITAVAGIFLFNFLSQRNNTARTLIQRYISKIS